MKTSNRIRSIAAAIMAVTLAAPGGVWADGGKHHNKGYSQHYGHNGGHYSKWRRSGNYHYNNHYYGGGHAKSGYGYYGHGYHNNNDDDDNDLWIGLAAGGLLGYIVGDAVNQPKYVTPSYQPAVVYPAATSTVTYPPANQGQSCLQEREYQTKVIVGGRQVDAYGTACLQPDGSWLRGPAQAAAY